MNKHSICLLGGTGFVGNHLATRLANEGWRVRLLTRNAARHRDLRVLPTVQIVQGDIHNTAFLRQQIAGQDAWLGEAGRVGNQRAIKLIQQLTKE